MVVRIAPALFMACKNCRYGRSRPARVLACKNCRYRAPARSSSADSVGARRCWAPNSERSSNYMAECLGAEWDDPINEVGWDHGFDDFVKIIDSDDLLWELDGPLGNEDLHMEFLSAFDHQWC